MHHELKIKEGYFVHIQEGKKTFEIRFNDRDYQVGDTVSFEAQGVENVSFSPAQRYEITYVHQGLGLDLGYVILGIKEVEEKTPLQTP